MCDRYGGAAAWDAHCDRMDREREKILEHATCEDCAHFHVLNESKTADAHIAFMELINEVSIVPRSDDMSADDVRKLVEDVENEIATFAICRVCDADGLEEIGDEFEPVEDSCSMFEPR